MEDKKYKSPIKKLLVFFKKSRDKWKEKYFEKKKELKKITNRIYDLENRKEEWKKRALEAEKALEELDVKAQKKKIQSKLKQ